jgi:hypothetical protein
MMFTNRNMFRSAFDQWEHFRDGEVYFASAWVSWFHMTTSVTCHI